MVSSKSSSRRISRVTSPAKEQVEAALALIRHRGPFLGHCSGKREPFGSVHNGLHKKHENSHVYRPHHRLAAGSRDYWTERAKLGRILRQSDVNASSLGLGRRTRRREPHLQRYFQRPTIKPGAARARITRNLALVPSAESERIRPAGKKKCGNRRNGSGAAFPTDLEAKGRKARAPEVV